MSEPDIELHNKVETPESKGLSVVRELVVHQSVLDAMASHVGSDTTVENGGVMLGQVDEKTGTVTITGSIAAMGAVSRVASLTFTHETWDHISEVQERSFPDTKMVGWYHSHPHFGIFLSDHDLFIHRNFFVEPWQVAYVIDPLLQQEGFFVWEDGDVARLAHWQVVSDGGSPEGHLGVQEPARGMVPPPPAAPPKRGGTIMGMTAIGLAAFLVGSLGGWFLGNNREDSTVQPPVKLVQTAPASASQLRKIGWKAASLAAPPDGVEVPFFAGPGRAGMPQAWASVPQEGFKSAKQLAVQTLKGNHYPVLLSDDGRSIWRSGRSGSNAPIQLSIDKGESATGLAIIEEQGSQRIWIATNLGRILRLDLDGQPQVEEVAKLPQAKYTLSAVKNGTIAVDDKSVYFVSTNGKKSAARDASRRSVAGSGTRVWIATPDPDRPSDRILHLFDNALNPDTSGSFPAGGIQIGADATLSAVGDQVCITRFEPCCCPGRHRWHDPLQ